MKRPYRIRQAKNGKAKNALGDDELGDEVMEPQKNLNPVDIMIRRDRTKGVDAQKKKFMEKALVEKNQRIVQEAKAEQNVNIWENVSHTEVQIKPKTKLTINSAFSYNPDKQLLIDAQKQAANIYLDQDIKHLRFKLEQVQTRFTKQISEDAFLQLYGEQTEQRIDQRQLQHQTVIENELQKVLELKAQLEQSQISIDDYEKLRTSFKGKINEFEKEIEELDNLKEQHLAKVDSSLQKTLSKQRAEIYEQFLLDIETEKNLLVQIKNIYQQTDFGVKMENYNLPLISEIKGNLRQTKIFSHVEEQFKKLKRDEQFDDQNEEIKFDKIKGIKTVTRLRK